VKSVLPYVLFGAAIGAFVGYLIPPGSLFWFLFGAVSGFTVNYYLKYK
jgi:uncharacterized membrane protein YraQ (UPF0718 family)